MGQPDINIIIISFHWSTCSWWASSSALCCAPTKKGRVFAEKQRAQLEFDAIIARTRTEIQEQDFKTFRELHDNIGQLLSVAKMQLNMISKPQTQRMPESSTNRPIWFPKCYHKSACCQDRSTTSTLYSMAWSDPYKPRLTDSTACIFSTRCSMSTVRLPPSIPIAKSCSSAWCRKPCPMLSNTHGYRPKIVIHFGADQIDISIEDNGIGIHQINQDPASASPISTQSRLTGR